MEGPPWPGPSVRGSWEFRRLACLSCGEICDEQKRNGGALRDSPSVASRWRQAVRTPPGIWRNREKFATKRQLLTQRLQNGKVSEAAGGRKGVAIGGRDFVLDVSWPFAYNAHPMLSILLVPLYVCM